jgi:hypothetical protein
LLYDPARIDPAAWLAERLGAVTILSEPAPVVEDPAGDPAGADTEAAESAVAGVKNPGNSSMRTEEPAAAAVDDDDWLQALKTAADTIRAAPSGLIPTSSIDANELSVAVGITATRRCRWIVNTTGVVFRRCGELILDDLDDRCPTHREQYAETLLGDPIRPPMPFGPFPTTGVTETAA